METENNENNIIKANVIKEPPNKKQKIENIQNVNENDVDNTKVDKKENVENKISLEMMLINLPPQLVTIIKQSNIKTISELKSFNFNNIQHVKDDENVKTSNLSKNNVKNKNDEQNKDKEKQKKSEPKTVHK